MREVLAELVTPRSHVALCTNRSRHRHMMPSPCQLMLIIVRSRAPTMPIGPSSTGSSSVATGADSAKSRATPSCERPLVEPIAECPDFGAGEVRSHPSAFCRIPPLTHPAQVSSRTHPSVLDRARGCGAQCAEPRDIGARRICETGGSRRSKFPLPGVARWMLCLALLGKSWTEERSARGSIPELNSSLCMRFALSLCVCVCQIRPNVVQLWPNLVELGRIWPN